MDKVTRREKEKPEYVFILVALGIIALLSVVFNSISGGRFLTVKNVNAIFLHTMIQSFIAWAWCMAYTAGFRDFSMGAVVMLAGWAAGEAGNRFGYVGLVVAGLAVGILLMFINYNIFAYSKIPPWVAGLGLCMIYEGIGIFYSNSMIAAGKTVVMIDESIRALTSTGLIYVIFVVGFIFIFLFYNRLNTGLSLRAMGDSEDVAKAMGVNTKKTLILVGIVAGTYIGMAGILNQSYNSVVFAKTGLSSLSFTFKPMATVLLAKVLQRKINMMVGIPICCMFIYIVFNMLTLLGVPSGTLQDAILGGILLIFAASAQSDAKGVVK